MATNELSVLTGPVFPSDMKLYAKLIRRITDGLTELAPDGFSLVYGGEDEERMPLHQRVFVPLDGPQVIYLPEPDEDEDDVMRSREEIFSRLLREFGKHAWSAKVKTGWDGVLYEGFCAINTDPHWSPWLCEQRKLRLWRKFESLMQGMSALQEMQGALFALLAMRQFLHCYGNYVTDPDATDIRDDCFHSAVRWILWSEGRVPLLALWFDQHGGEVRDLGQLLRMEPLRAIGILQETLRDFTRGSRASVATKIQAIDLTHMAGEELHMSGEYLSSDNEEGLRNDLKRTVHGLQMLTKPPSELRALLDSVLVHGRR